MPFKTPAQRRRVMAQLKPKAKATGAKPAVKVPNNKVTVKRLGPSEFDLQGAGYDWHLSRWRGVWVLEQFNPTIKDNDEAHMRTIECESKQDALLYVRSEDPRPGSEPDAV
jgi:hypothetical protein